MPTISISQDEQLKPRAHAPAGGSNLIASFKNDIIGQTATSFASPTKAMHGDEASAHTATTTLYHGNQQYIVTAISDSSGNVSERYAYTAYGQPTFFNASGTVQTSSAVSNRYTYTGRELDSTLGLHHFRARWMSGLTGRFLSRNPIGFDGSPWLLYEYVESNPLVGIDPSGKLSSYHSASFGSCAAGAGSTFNLSWDDGAIPCDGYLIIDTKASCGSKKCPCLPEDAGNVQTVSSRYISAIPVKKGELLSNSYTVAPTFPAGPMKKHVDHEACKCPLH